MLTWAIKRISKRLKNDFEWAMVNGPSVFELLRSNCTSLVKWILHSIWWELKKIIAVVYNISNAFDKVWHRGLIFKLRSIGLFDSSLDWITDYMYLENNPQQVCIKASLSSWKKIFAGLQQGSVIGPLLFLIAIIDLVNIIGTSIRLFADDKIQNYIVQDPLLTTLYLNQALSKILPVLASGQSIFIILKKKKKKKKKKISNHK